MFISEEMKRAWCEIVMRGAFVVQLRKAGHVVAGQMEGSVEEVDTGKHLEFRSQDELIVFLRERFAEMCRDVPDKEGVK